MVPENGRRTYNYLRATLLKRTSLIQDENSSRHSPLPLLVHPIISVYLLQPKITETTRSKSFSVIAVPDGRQRPRLNKSSATLPPTILALYLFLFCPAFNP